MSTTKAISTRKTGSLASLQFGNVADELSVALNSWNRKLSTTRRDSLAVKIDAVTEAATRGKVVGAILETAVTEIERNHNHERRVYTANRKAFIVPNRKGSRVWVYAQVDGKWTNIGFRLTNSEALELANRRA